MKSKLITITILISALSAIILSPFGLVVHGIGLGQEQPVVSSSPPNEYTWYIDISNSPAPAKATLRAANAASIEFRSQNGLTLSGKPPVVKMVPHLVLYRNGELTAAAERTVIFEVTDLPVPPGGITLTLEIETQHPDPDQGSGSRDRISIGMQEKHISNPTDVTEVGTTVVMTQTFDAVIEAISGDISTPTDYLKINLTLTDADHSVNEPVYQQTGEFAVLLESQWVVQLGNLSESVEGAAPDELVVYACDMFPFQHDEKDDSSRLARHAVGEYIQEELIPLMVQAIRQQTNDWGFVWNPAWTSYREGEDAERLSVALTRPGVWFHGRAPGSAHSGISINTRHKDYAAYDNLTDAVMGAFHHELFHNLQRNIQQVYGGDGNIDANNGALAFFTEGMAIMATSVGQTEVEFAGERTFLFQANSFLGGDQYQDNYLKTGYDGINPYRAALYWRFLYETCGGMVDGVEDPSAGMQIIRKTLESLFSPEFQENVLDKRVSELLPLVLDEALADAPTCPYRDYDESLVAFARHIYTLNLSHANCHPDSSPGGCELFDPANLYQGPSAVTMEISAGQQVYQGEISGSYGMEFIDINLPTVDDQVTVEFIPESSSSAEFRLEILRIYGEDIEDGQMVIEPVPLEDGLIPGEAFSAQIMNGADDRLALIITRVDNDQVEDRAGDYLVRVR